MEAKVEEYIYNQDPKVVDLLLKLRIIILDCHPQIVESLKYKIPFYSYKKNLCYLNVKKGKYFDLGFVDGFKLSNIHGKLLIGDNRTVIKSLRFFSINDFEEDIVRETIIEAMLLQ